MASAATLGEPKFTFEVDWYDQQADIIRHYRVLYYPVTSSIEMFDVKNARVFLKKQQIPSVQLDDFFIGSQVTILSRVLKVTDYGDVHTRKQFENNRQRTFAMIKPEQYANIGKIIDATQKSGFVLNKLKMSRFNNASAGEFYGEHKGKPFFNDLKAHMTSDVCIGMELVAQDAVAQWRACIGPTNSDDAKRDAPGSIRGVFGLDQTKNAVHGADSIGSYKREVDFWFGGEDPEARPMQTTAVLNNCTLCLIKPHILKDAQAGEVIDMILAAGFEISAMEIFQMSRAVIEEFYCVYKGVIPEYLPIIENFTSGPTLALEIRQQNAVNSFRELCGPHDPEIAKHLRPETIRAKFGLDRVRNAVHCTDMSEDGCLEVRYFFELLQKHQF